MADAAEVPRTECPICSHPFDRASAINEPGIYETPNAGDTTVCIECCTWLVFRDDLSVRRMTEREIRELKPEERETLMQLSKVIQRVHESQYPDPKMRK